MMTDAEFEKLVEREIDELIAAGEPPEDIAEKVQIVRDLRKEITR